MLWPQKKEIYSLLASHREEIEAGLLRVLLLDECHLLWGDTIGYVWGKTDTEITVPITNERNRQTYYGVVDYLDKELLLKSDDTANSKNTIDYLSYLLNQSPNQKLIIFGDGALYHHSKKIQNFLAFINQGLTPEEWKIH